MDEEKNNEQQQPQQSKASQAVDTAKNLNQMRKARSARAAKKAGNAAKAASKSSRLSGIATKLMGLLKYFAIIIIAIILVIGISTFILAGLGLIWGGISNVIEGIADWWQSIKSGEESIVKYDTIQDTMNYLYSMDYDLYGYGFVTQPAASADSQEGGGSGWKITPDNSSADNDKERSKQGTIEVDERKYKEFKQ